MNLMRYVRGFLRVGSALIRLFLFATLLSLSITGFSSGKPVMFGVRPMFVPTDSMSPTIPPGSLIITRPIDAEDVHPGMIVTYTRRAQFLFFPDLYIPLTVVHRVIRIEGDIFYFRGDNDDCYAYREETDLPVSAEAIGYEVISVVPLPIVSELHSP